jgi:signal transduction histidine kinase
MTGSAAPRAPTLSATLTLRLIIVAIIAAALQMLVVFVYYSLKSEKTGVLIALHEAQEVANHVHVAADQSLSVRLGPDFVKRYADHPDDYGLEVVDAMGRVVESLNGSMLADLRIDFGAQPDLWTKVVARSGQPVRITVRRFDAHKVPFWIAIGIRHDPAGLESSIMLDEMFDHVVEPMLPVIAISLLVCIVVTRRSLRPLTRAAEAAAKIDPRDNTMRLPTAALPKEVADLVAAVNLSLARLQEMFEYQRQFLATAAHELRTPLAVLMLQLDRLSGPNLPELRSDVEHMTRLVNQMLLVARLDALPAPQWAAVDLAGIAKAVVSRLAPLAISQDRSLELVTEGEPACRGDGDMISDALRNLVENAIRHAPKHTAIRIVAGPGGRLAVDDAGPGISASDRLRLHERVWHSPKRSELGAGLGLFIVGKVVAAHNGTVRISTSAWGGARVEMIFPPAPPSGPATERVSRNDMPMPVTATAD